ncbi:hypothetical protein N1031_08630 [Herbiconiux moechotypicola]|nr:hypothetical protein [Herbiconiux moechotypicola]MCS5729824.1 hypothetical protein [Herbiconiux moechotypicola]
MSDSDAVRPEGDASSHEQKLHAAASWAAAAVALAVQDAVRGR